MSRVIVLASNFPRWKGDSWSPFIQYQAEGMARKGYEMHVLAPHTDGAAAHERIGDIEVHRFRYSPERLQSLCYGGGILQNLRQQPLRWALVPPFLIAEFAAMTSLVRRHRIDLIHAHWFIPQGLVATLGTLFGQCPIVMTAHAGDVFATRDGVRQRLLRLAASRAGACTAVSGPLGRAFEQLTGIAPRIIPMGVDVARFTPDYRRRPEIADGALDAPRIISVGRLAEKKGIGYLIEAFAMLARSRPAARLSVVGDGPMRAELAALADRLGVAARVTFAGMVRNEDLPAHLREADIFAMPSIVDSTGDQEGLPVAVLEAAASGVPIIASDVGGTSDFVDHEATGLLIPARDKSALHDAIVRLAGDPGLRRTLADNARRLVTEQFSWDSVSDRFDEVYRGLLR